jgi:anti-sigma factor RsiW
MSRMECSEARVAVSALVDDELSGEQRRLVEEHLASCAACSTIAEDYRHIGRSLKAAAFVRAPPYMAERIRLQIAGEGGEDRSLATGGWKTYAGHAAALLVVAGLSASAAWHAATTRSAHNSLKGDILSAHVRSLLQDRPTQIASSDRHTVKPWFIGRLDYAPPVRDLTAEGFPLTGARLDFVGDRRVASIVYMRRQHVINLFVWPVDAGAAAEAEPSAVKGYNALTWTADGVVHWAISDLNLPELKQFQSLLAGR